MGETAQVQVNPQAVVLSHCLFTHMKPLAMLNLRTQAFNIVLKAFVPKRIAV